MSERRRIVTLDAAGSPTTVLDLESPPFMPTRGTTVIKPPPPNAILAKRERRHGGSSVVGELHDNGSFSWKSLVQGTSSDNVLANLESALAVFESTRTDLFFEWRPEGATNSTFYDLGGPITWTPTYEWAQFLGSQSMYVDVEIPVNPLGRLTPQSFTISSTSLPAIISLTGVGGTAPALADVTLNTSGGSAPIWALFGWTPHPPASSLAGTPPAPFGIIEAETAASLTAWAAIGTDATYRGSNGIRVATSGAGTAQASYTIDPSVMTVDDFAFGEIDFEVWVRYEIAVGVVAPNLKASLLAQNNAVFANAYASPYGSAGKTVVLPSAGTVKRFTRLGVITAGVDPSQAAAARLVIDGAWAAGSTGNFGLDYLVLVPVRSRACSKSGVANDGTYPRFIGSTSSISKTIRGNDLSGLVGLGAGAKSHHSGIGGSLIELPPGNVDLLIKLSSLVPDDPTVDATTEALAHSSVTGTVVITPRVWLAK